MKNKTRSTNIILLAGILLLVLVGSYIGYTWLSKSTEPSNISRVGASESPAANTPASAQSRQKAPDFTVLDANSKEVKLSSFLGKPVILNFWASWCGPCRNEMPDMQNAFKTHGGDIAFVMVNLTDGSRETLKTAKDFLKEAGYTFPVYFDTKFSAANAYGIESIPTTYFIDKDGYVVAIAHGTIDQKTLNAGIGMIAPE